MPIIVDTTQVIIGNCIAHLSGDLKKSSDKDEAINLIKHMTFMSLLSFKKQYGATYGNLILACDDRTYWRKEYFPAYKGQRKHSRDDSSLNWDAVFEAINQIKADIKAYFPYKIIQTDGAEADDVIAVLTKYFQTNELSSEGIFDDVPQPILILSSDTDFAQLQKYDNVKQWSPMQKKFVNKGNPLHYLNEHIASGDGGDNFPNILTADKWAEDRATNEDVKDRQKPLKKARLEEFIKRGIEACQTDEERRNWQRNQTLADFDYIPQKITDAILVQYIDQQPNKNRMSLMNFFTKHKMKKLFECVQDF